MNQRKSNKLQGVIFDLDGTLADTHLDFAQMCKDANLPVGTPILEHLESIQDAVQVSQILSIVEKHELAGALKAKWILDAESTLNRLCEAAIPMAIVTRNMREAAKLTVDKLNIPIEVIITREDCKPKPDPEGLLMVAKNWDIIPENLIYIGDYKFDLMAANKAGMMSCLLSNDKNSDFRVLADKVIDSFKQLEPLFFPDHVEVNKKQQ